MKNKITTSNHPVEINLEPGTYFWCACGRSKNQPFCDGSHQGTGINPSILKIDAKKTVYLCQCKQSKNPPYCDGTHNSL